LRGVTQISCSDSVSWGRSAWYDFFPQITWIFLKIINLEESI
jgi:hypothetical protein